MSLRSILPSFVLLPLALCLPGCVTETVPEAPPATVKRFGWPVPALPAGVYRGVTIYFEVDPRKDLSASELEWMSSDVGEGAVNVRLTPLIPAIDGRVERLEYKDLHRIEFYNGMFHIGDAGFTSRFFPSPRASLFVFKRRTGDFRFSFRGQAIVVRTGRSWIPAVFYSSEEIGPDGEPAAPESRRKWVRQFVRVGSSVIETDPLEGVWRVDGRRYDPDPSAPLDLRSAVR